MKQFLLMASVVMLALSGCIKGEQGCVDKRPSEEEAQMVAYANANGYTMTKHNSGMYYQIVNQGTGVTPSLNSRVFISYTGKLLNGTVFDQQTNPANTGWTLSSLIEGWQVGVPLIQKGGKIRLLIPSAMAYGCSSSRVSPIPDNSVLFFEIDLVDVQ